MRLFMILFTCFFAAQAQAFCGLYVARADGELFNEASKVVMIRSGRQTTITMSADYQGEASEFAMVVPTPRVLKREQIRTVKAETLDALDAYSAPRLVEYDDYDPCEGGTFNAFVEMVEEPADATPQRRRGPAAFGVKVRAEYAVGEYDIVILDVKQSDGLTDYLLQECYNIPDGAREVLSDYIASGMKFFVACVALDRHDGAAELSPLQLQFSTRKFMLPIKLGQVNAKGSQDLLLMTLSNKGRVHPKNYPLHRLHTDKEIPVFVRQRFGEFYNALFDRHIESVGGAGIIMEYAWDMAWCDPCAADPLSNEQLAELGVDWLEEGAANAGQDVFVTRLHARYDQRFEQDIELQVTADKENFQGRYIMRNPYTGPLSCPATDYIAAVKDRTSKEAEEVAKLTGWRLSRIREEIAKTVPVRYR